MMILFKCFELLVDVRDDINFIWKENPESCFYPLRILFISRVHSIARTWSVFLLGFIGTFHLVPEFLISSCNGAVFAFTTLGKYLRPPFVLFTGPDSNKRNSKHSLAFRKCPPPPPPPPPPSSWPEHRQPITASIMRPIIVIIVFLSWLKDEPVSSAGIFTGSDVIGHPISSTVPKMKMNGDKWGFLDDNQHVFGGLFLPPLLLEMIEAWFIDSKLTLSGDSMGGNGRNHLELVHVLVIVAPHPPPLLHL